MQEYFDSLETVIAPELRRRCARASLDKNFSRAEFLSEQPWDYLHQWRLECYPRAEITEWTRLSLFISMIFVVEKRFLILHKRKFLMAGEVRWHLPFIYGDTAHRRSIQEYQMPAIQGERQSSLAEFVRTSQTAFLKALPKLYKAFEEATERGRPCVYVEVV